MNDNLDIEINGFKYLGESMELNISRDKKIIIYSMDELNLVNDFDYIINSKALCFHVYNGTICKSNKCRKIHIHRCKYGNKCIINDCKFLHDYDMKTNKAKINYLETQNDYNSIYN